MDKYGKLIALAQSWGYKGGVIGYSSVTLLPGPYKYLLLCELEAWLRDEYNIRIKIDDYYTQGKLRYDFSIALLGSQEDNPQGNFETYAEALFAGINAVLTKTIEL